MGKKKTTKAIKRNIRSMWDLPDWLTDMLTLNVDTLYLGKDPEAALTNSPFTMRVRDMGTLKALADDDAGLFKTDVEVLPQDCEPVPVMTFYRALKASPPLVRYVMLSCQTTTVYLNLSKSGVQALLGDELR